jgi:triosephosphate isomerase
MAEALEALNDEMRRLATENALPLYDLARAMPKSLAFFYDDVHFNENGAHTAAVNLAAFIQEQNLIKPRR